PARTECPALSAITAPTLGLGDVRAIPERASSSARRRKSSSVGVTLATVKLATEPQGAQRRTRSMEKTTTRDFIVFLAESRNQRLRPAQRLPRHCALWARAGRAPAGPRKDRRVVEACGPADGAGIPEGSGAEGDVCGLRASKYLSEAIAPKLQVLIE